ncbi:MAG: dTMP kinase [Chitinivibrionales bacterium]|nr:dTMP kinase [Chitinivibrionales bacterium]
MLRENNCMIPKGLFLTFEGVDGCGKSTQVARAVESLQRRGVACMATREPGGTRIAEKIRSLLLSPDNDAMVDRCEVLLYLAARAQHVEEKILPALADGVVVVCDRFQEATFAYQGWGRGMNLQAVQQCNSFATAGITPDHTFVFDINIDIAHTRLHNMDKSPDRLEGNSRSFFKRVRQGYQDLVRSNPQRMTLLDGGRPIDELSLNIISKLDFLLEQKRIAHA